MKVKDAFLYEYLKYIKDELKYLNSSEKHDQANVIKSIICSDAIGNIKTNYLDQKEALNEISTIVESIKVENCGKTDAKVERNLKRYAESVESIQQYLIHYETLLKHWDCSFVVIFENNDIWTINYTRSLRKDRIQTHITRFNYLHSDKNVLVISDYRAQDDQSKSLLKKMKDNPSLFGTPVVVVSFEELLDMLMENIFCYKRENNALVRLPSKTKAAVINGLIGVEIEKIYGKCLGNKENYDLYIDNINSSEAEETKGSFLPTEFDCIIDYILLNENINKSDISKIETLDIGDKKLKPDVVVKLYLSDNITEKEVGISVKSSGAEKVSFHEKKAEDFIRVLEIESEDVKDALIRFQEVKSVRNLSENEQLSLTRYFSNADNKRKLVTWVVSGEKSDEYCAQYVLSHHYENDGDELGITIVSANEYIDQIISQGDSRTFNSGFSWTYKRSIQLKGPML